MTISRSHIRRLKSTLSFDFDSRPGPLSTLRKTGPVINLYQGIGIGDTTSTHTTQIMVESSVSSPCSSCFWSRSLYLCKRADNFCFQHGFRVSASASRCIMLWFIIYVWINKKEVILKFNWSLNGGQDSTETYPPGVHHSTQYYLMVGKPFFF